MAQCLRVLVREHHPEDLGGCLSRVSALFIATLESLLSLVLGF